MTIPLTLYGKFTTEKEASAHCDLIIGGGIYQKQGEFWLVFSARELAESV